MWKYYGSHDILERMTPFLVRARIPDLGPSAEGALTIFAAAVATEREALDAVRAKAPKFTVRDVIGHATEGLTKLLKLQPGEVRQL